MRSIVFTADKGGVGKTTTVANVAVRLMELGKKVLVIDADGQGDVTYAILGARPPLMKPGGKIHPSMFHLLVEQAEFSDVVVKSPRYKNVHVLPSNKDLDRANVHIANNPGGTTVLKFALDELPKNAYDYVLIDTAKGRDVLLINAVAAANEAVVMATPGTLEVDAVSRTIEHVDDVRKKTLLGGEKPKVIGILMTRADVRTDESIETVTSAARSSLEKMHPGLLFKTIIPEAVDFRKSISQSVSIFEFEERKRAPSKGDDDSRYTVRGRKAAEAYEDFVEELVKHDR